MESNQIQMLADIFECHAVSDHFVDVNKMIQLAPNDERVCKVAHRLGSEEKKALKNPDTLEA